MENTDIGRHLDPSDLKVGQPLRGPRFSTVQFVTRPVPNGLRFVRFGTGETSENLKHDEVGRWLYFDVGIISSLLKNRGFELTWQTEFTDMISAPHDLNVFFGVNEHEKVVVYAQDIARLELWHQKIWLMHNLTPDGGIGQELAAAQVMVEPATTIAPEVLARNLVENLEQDFEGRFGQSLFDNSVAADEEWGKITRFQVHDDTSLLRLAKELHRVFGDRLSKSNLQEVVGERADQKLRGLKLLEVLCSDVAGQARARDLCGPLFGINDLRTGDAHPTGSKIEQAYKLCNIDRGQSHHRQAFELIQRFSQTLSGIGYCLFVVRAGV